MNTFNFNPKFLVKALQIVSAAFPSRTNRVPILDYFLFEVTAGVLRISVSDLQVTFRACMAVVGNSDFSAVVPRTVVKYLSTLKVDTCTFTWVPDSYSAEFTYNGERAKYSGEEPKDFPKSPEVDKDLFTIPAGVFGQFKTLLEFTGTDDLRPALTGISFAPVGKELKMVTSDGNYLRVESLHAVFSEIGFVLPAKPARILAGLKVPADVPVKMFTNANGTYLNTRFTFEHMGYDLELITKNIDEKIPNYMGVVPSAESTTTWADLNKKTFLPMLDKALLFANPLTKMVKFTFGEKVSLHAENLDEAQEITVNIHGVRRGEDLTIGFNGELLKTVVEAQSEAFTIDLTRPNKALTIRENGSITLLMPLMLAQG
jgi:DNA polymerase-3 subunit beta